MSEPARIEKAKAVGAQFDLRRRSSLGYDAHARNEARRFPAQQDFFLQGGAYGFADRFDDAPLKARRIGVRVEIDLDHELLVIGVCGAVPLEPCPIDPGNIFDPLADNCFPTQIASSSSRRGHRAQARQ